MKKTLLLILLTINFVTVFAQTMPAPPVPNADGPGYPDTPVDMYIYPLLAVAALLISVFAKQINLKNVK